MTGLQDISNPFWQQPESRRLEFKETLPKGDQIARTAVAFANGAGGKIVFGVRNEPREIVGIPDDDIFSLEEKISSRIFDQCAPTIIPEIYIQAAEGKHKGTFVRIGSSNRVASHEMLESLEREKRKISFDAIPVYDLSPGDIDLKRFKADYKSATGRNLTGQHLKNMGLLVAERNQVHPTHAGVLLADSPVRKRLFPYAKVECARFKGTDTKVFLDQTTIEGPIHTAVEPCLSFIKKNIALGSRIGEIYREDRWEYPLEAIREAIANAVIHRDYSILGSDIKVAIFDDMLEITSPGPLPDTLPLEELGTGRSEIRNRILAPLFKDLKLIEAWGTGIQKMRNELSNYPEIQLNLNEVGHTFQVQFRKKEDGTTQRTSTGQVIGQVGTEPGPSRPQITGEVTGDVTGDVTGEVQRLLSTLVNSSMTRSEAQKILGLKSQANFRDRYLQPALNAGLIEMTIPGKPKSSKQKYALTEKGRVLLKRQKQSVQ